MLLNLQSDLEGLLLSDPALAEVPVLVERKGLTEEDVVQAIGVYNTRAGSEKVGLVIIVMMPAVRKPRENAVLQLAVTATLRIIELPVVNQGATGIGLAAEDCATHLLQLAHNWSPAQGRTLTPDADAIDPAQAPDAHIAYDVNLTWTDGLAQPPKAPRPTITYDEGSEQVTLTCSDQDATIHYTTDGSFPHPENPAATIYNQPLTYQGVIVTHEDGLVTTSQPFAAASGTQIRAIAIRTGHAPSNLKSITLSTPS